MLTRNKDGTYTTSESDGKQLLFNFNQRQEFQDFEFWEPQLPLDKGRPPSIPAQMYRRIESLRKSSAETLEHR
ncbi:MAG: hypothetical protein AABW80_04925 [Nanoarchaeota archaeon]